MVRMLNAVGEGWVTGGPVGEERAPLSPNLLQGLPPSLASFILRLPAVPGEWPHPGGVGRTLSRERGAEGGRPLS